MITQELVWELRKFRMLVESDAGEPCEALDLNVALLLDDLMNHLGFGSIEHDDVLGESAAQFVKNFVQERAPMAVVDAEVVESSHALSVVEGAVEV